MPESKARRGPLRAWSQVSGSRRIVTTMCCSCRMANISERATSGPSHGSCMHALLRAVAARAGELRSSSDYRKDSGNNGASHSVHQPIQFIRGLCCEHLRPHVAQAMEAGVCGVAWVGALACQLICHLLHLLQVCAVASRSLVSPQTQNRSKLYCHRTTDHAPKHHQPS